MTPAEQGQVAWVRELTGDARIWDEVDRLTKELEMCQRYFPFLQRSRADYKRRYEEAERNLSACQEELARLQRAKR